MKSLTKRAGSGSGSWSVPKCHGSGTTWFLIFRHCNRKVKMLLQLITGTFRNEFKSNFWGFQRFSLITYPNNSAVSYPGAQVFFSSPLHLMQPNLRRVCNAGSPTGWNWVARSVSSRRCTRWRWSGTGWLIAGSCWDALLCLTASTRPIAGTISRIMSSPGMKMSGTQIRFLLHVFFSVVDPDLYWFWSAESGSESRSAKIAHKNYKKC